MPSQAAPDSNPRPERFPPWLPIAAGAALVVVAVLLFVLLRGGDDDDNPKPSTAAQGTTPPIGDPPCGTPPTGTPVPTIAAKKAATSSATKAEAFGKSLNLPVYWAGPVGEGTSLELTTTTQGVYLRYLTGGAKPGDKRPNFLTVGSYPQADPLKSVCQSLQTKGTQRITLPNNGLGVFNPARPMSIYIAYPKGTELVEVFSPTAGRARTLVQDGRIRPVDG